MANDSSIETSLATDFIFQTTLEKGDLESDWLLWTTLTFICNPRRLMDKDTQYGQQDMCTKYLFNEHTKQTSQIKTSKKHENLQKNPGTQGEVK